MPARTYQVTRENTTERIPGVRVAEASTLRLAPGLWPAQLTTLLGNCAPFVRRRVERNADQEVTVVHYIQADGTLKLEVLND